MSDFLFLGGDLRMLYAARYLNKRFDCSIYGFDKEGVSLPLPVLSEPESCGTVILPLPTSTDGRHINGPYCSRELDFSLLEKVLAPGGTVFTGKSFPYLDEICQRNGFVQENYFAREELQLLNAVPTAEGALEIMLKELPVTVFGSRALITGFGRIGKVLARCLLALGAEPTVCARRCEQLAEAEILGCATVSLHDDESLEKLLPCFDAVVNTVPAPVFDRRRLARLRKDCLVIDLASKTGIEDMELAKAAGVNVVWALSLPGRTAPVTAGEIIGKTIENMLNERRDKNA